MQTAVSLDHQKRMLRHLQQQELVRMALEAVEVGTVLYDNDPRQIGRKVIVQRIDDTFAFCRAGGRSTRVRLDRIHSDAKVRHSGFSTIDPAPRLQAQANARLVGLAPDMIAAVRKITIT